MKFWTGSPTSLLEVLPAQWPLLALGLGAAGLVPWTFSDQGADAAPLESKPPRSDREQELHARALSLLEKPGRKLEATLPKEISELSYDGFRKIMHRADARLWRGEERGFEADLLPLGGLFRIPVRIQEVREGALTEIPFSAERFEVNGGALPLESLNSLGHSGFRLRHALNRPDTMDEFLVFQGASYFRGVGRNQIYGTSARGLAIKTADPLGEEFPAFTEFWLETPEADATQVRFFGLLESQSVVGVYEFLVRPGDETLMEIKATVYARTDLERVGVAPLTSMFLFDTTNRFAFDDFREAVCDANALQMIGGSGERILRPLTNPKELQVSAFMESNPQGFGLVQQHRGFAEYGDIEARYEKRPSTWIEPVGDWGAGAIILVEIPMRTEFNDNIVCFWRPEGGLAKGESRTWSYRLRWCDAPPDDIPLARVKATRTGLAPNTGQRLFVVDFEIPDQLFEGATVEGVTTTGSFEVEAHASKGEIVQARLEKLPGNGARRVTMEFEPGDAKVCELNVKLKMDGVVASETWLYRWTKP